MNDQLSSDLASLRIQRDAPPERGKVLGYAIALIAGAAAIGAFYFVGMPYIEAKVFRPEVAVTEIAVISPAEASVELTATGYVVADTMSKVGAKIEGRISKLFVKEGDRVQAGAPIAELEATEQVTMLDAARVRALAAKARAETARANLAEARIQYERQKALAERGAAPKATAQDLEARVHSLQESVNAATAEIAAAEAEVRSLQVRLQFMKIEAPISGTITDKLAEVGEMVSPSSNPIVEMTDFSTLLVEIDVPEGRLHRVKPKGPCEIVLDAYPGRRYRGEMQEIVPRVNRSKASVPVKVRFVDAPEGVLPNMAARVSFLAKALDAEAMKDPPKVVAPSAAIAERAGAKVVFVLDGDQVRMTPVRLGAPFGGGFEVAEGPPPGTKLVKNPPDTLTDGQRVKERNP